MVDPELVVQQEREVECDLIVMDLLRAASQIRNFSEQEVRDRIDQIEDAFELIGETMVWATDYV